MNRIAFKRPLLSVLGAALVLLFTAFLAVDFWHLSWTRSQQAGMILQSVETLLNLEVHKQAEVLLSALYDIQRDKELIAAFKQRDRRRLLEAAQRYFKALQEQNRVTHFYFTGPDRVNFLRVHQPGRNGDVIARTTAKRAQENGRAAWGLDLGPNGAFSLRVVLPWRSGDRLLGYLELGKEVDGLLPDIRRSLKTDLYVLLYKKMLNRAQWEQARRQRGLPADWDRFPQFVLAGRAGGPLPASAAEFASKPHPPRGMAPCTGLGFGSDPMVGAIPLRQSDGIRVGELLAVYDMGARQGPFVKQLAMAAAVCLVLGGGLIFLFYRLLGRTEVSLERSRSDMRRQYQEQLKSIFKTNPLWVTLSTLEDGVYLEVNDAFTEITGYSREEVLGRTSLELGVWPYPEERRRAAEILAKKGSLKNFEISFRRKSGEIRKAIWLAGLIDIDGGQCVISVLNDITDRKRTEEALRESEERLSAMADAANDAIIMMDHKGRISFWNQAAGEIFGYSEEEALGRDLHELVTAEHYAAAFRKNFPGFLESGQGGAIGKTLELEGIRKSGEVFDLELSLSAMRVRGRWHSVGIVRDISERKRAEDELDAYREHLEDMVRARTADMEKVNRRLLAEEEALKESEARFRTLAESIPNVPVHCCDAERRVVFWNRACELVYGYTAAEALGRRLEDLIVPHKMREKMREDFKHIWAGEESAASGEMQLMRKDGSPAPVYHSHVVQTNARGEKEVFCIEVDLTELKRHQEELLRMGGVFENTTEGITITDAEANILDVNPAFSAITGYSAEEAIGANPRVLKSDRHKPEFYQNMWDSLKRDGHWSGEIWNRRKDGDVYPEWLSINAIKDERGRVVNYVAVFHDLSDVKRTEAEMKHLAYHDALTGLPNRMLFNDRLEMALAHARRENLSLAVLYLDLDNFKNINDSLGHFVGDLLLQETAGRIKQCIREEDTLARLGGDEFILILPELSGPKDAAGVARKILDAFKEPFVIEDAELFVTASLGVTIYPEDGRDVGTLVKNSDMAMYRAKERGKNAYELFTPSMNQEITHRLALERDLRRALERGEFAVHYQPKVDLASGAVTGAEALVRWERPGLGMVSPGEFIPLAEAAGLIVGIGQWVLEQACRQAKRWRRDILKDFTVAVNLSARQFQQPDLVDMVARTLRETGLEPEGLKLEITESMVMYNVEEALETMNRLTGMGVALSMDDFGTGYSSLSYLKRFPLAELKIDKSFIDDIPQDQDALAITRGAVFIARSLGLKVVAEGVETEEQLAFLRALQCDQMQGFLFSRPIPDQEFTALLKEKRRI